MNSSSLRRALLSLGLILSVTASSALADGPANDFFGAAETISGASGSITRPVEAIDGAGTEIGEPLHAGVGGISVWYNWTAPISGAAAFDSVGSEFDTILAVYTGNSVVNLTKVAENDNDAATGDVTSRVVFPITAGTTYRIAFVGQDGAVGAYNLAWQTTTAGLLRFSKTAYRVSEDSSEPSQTIRVERVGSTAGIASVDLESVADTATTEDDYTAITSTVSFAAGESEQTITLSVVDDDTDEGDETLKLVLSNPVNAFLSIDPEVVVTIDDDEDNPVNDKFAEAFVMDGAMGNNVGSNVGAGAEFGESVHGGVGSGHSVWYRWTATGTGVLLLDTESSTIGLSDPLDTVIAVYTGSALGALTPVASNDNAALDEVTSRLALPVITGTTYYIAVDSKDATGSINFDWNFSAGGFIEFSQLAYTANEDGGTAQITVTRTAGTTTLATVTYTTVDDSAVAGQHYVGIPAGVLTFLAGETSKTFNVTLINNTDLGDRTFKLVLSAPTGDALLGTVSEATLTIDDDEDLPANDRFASARVISGDFGSTDAGNVGARLETGEPSHGPGSAHSVWFKWRAPATGVVTFDTAESVNLENDPLDTLLAVYTGSFLNTLAPVVKNDNTETTVTSRASFPVQAGTTYYIAVAGKNGAEGDIHLIWNFGAGGLLEFSQADYSVNEKGAPQATITVTRVDGSTGTVKVDFAVEDGTATEGDDYLAPSGSTTLTFRPGQTSRTFTVPIIDDTVVDGSDETVALSLGNVQGGAILGNLTTATLTINDNEDDPANDNLATPLNLSATTSPKIYVNSGASRETAEPLHGGVTGNRSLWFKWTAPANGVAVFDTAGSVESGSTPLDTVLAAYTGGPGYDKLVAVGANDDASADTVTSRLSFVTKANVTYLIAVDSLGLVGGEIHLAWTHSAGGIIQFTSPAYEGREGQSAFVTINRVGSLTGAVGATYTIQVLAGGNASTSDFAAGTGTVSFANGQANAFVDIGLATDGAVEGEETFAVVLSNPTGGAVLDAATAVVTIDDANDDPTNDNFASAQVITGGSGAVDGNNAGAGIEFGESADLSPAGHSIWFKWIAPSSGLATFSTAGSGSLVSPLDTVLTVSSGASLAAQLPLVSSDNLSETDPTSEVSFAAVAGTIYYISVDAFPPYSGPTKLTWSLATGGAFAFSSATYRGEENTPAGVEITVTRSGTTVNPASVDYATGNGTAIAGQDYTAKTGTLQFGPGQSIRSFVVPITNDEDVETDEAFTVTLSNPSGGGSLGAQTTATVTVFDNDVVVAGDKFAEATVLAEASGDSNASNTGAGRDAGENLPGFVLKNLGSGRTVWFTWKAPTTGTAVFDTTGSSTDASEALDTVMAVYTGTSLGNLLLVAENDEKPEEGVASEVSFHALANRTYYIAVDSTGDTSGDIQLHWRMEDTDGVSLFALTPDFKPTLTFKESYTEKVIGSVDEGFDTAGTVSYSATFAVSLADLDITGLDATTPVFIKIGDVEQTAVLGDDPAFVVNPALKKNSATIPIIDDDENELGTVKYAWDAAKLTVTITGKNPNLLAIAAPGFDGGDEPIVDQSLDATLTFGGLTGTRTVYFDGSASTSIKKLPEENEIDYSSVSISGSADYTAPTVAFKTPAANFRTSATTVTVTGTANENLGFNDVLMRVNGEGDFESISTEWLDEVGKKYGWSAEDVELRAGPNLIEIKAIDFSGNETVASRTIIRVAPSTIALQTVGQGTIKSSFTGTQLEVGKSYTVTATPAAGWVFKNWSGGLNSSDAKFTFDMPDGGLTLTANFVANPFLNLKGDFTGLVRPGAFNPSLTGAFELALTGTGGFSGKLNLGAESVSFKGQFDDSGFASVVVTRKGKTPVTLTFQLDLSGGTEQITGTISDGVFSSSFVSDRIVFNAKTNRAPQEGTYTVILPGAASLRDSGLQFGHGFLTMTVAANGSARLAGNLADNTTLSFSAQISKSGVMQVYAVPKNVVVAGSVLFGATPAAGANGLLNWYRNPVGAVAGLDAEILFAAESYTKPNKNARVLASLDASNGQTSSALRGAGYSNELTQNLVVGTDNKVIVTAAGNVGLLTLTINPAGGTFAGTIRKVGTTKTLPVKGAFLQGSGIGAGYFVDGVLSGYFTVAVPLVP